MKFASSFNRRSERHICGFWFSNNELRTNQPLTQADLQELDGLLFSASGFESREEFEAYFGAQPHLGECVRSLVGLDRDAAKAAFGAFLSGTKYTSAQIAFVNGVIDYLTERGVIELSQLSSAPLTSHPGGIFGVFPDDYAALLGVVKSINASARAT